jgi:hypothetical protein
MKRVQLIQVGILTITLVFGYKLVESIIATLITTFFQYGLWNDGASSVIIQYSAFTAFYFVAFFLLIRYHKQLAVYIDKQGQPATQGESPEIINIKLEQGSLLFIVLVAVCLLTLLEEIPTIILSVYYYFKRESGGGISSDNIESMRFKTSAIKFVFSLIVLFYSRKISDWFSQSPSKEPLAETTNES